MRTVFRSSEIGTTDRAVKTTDNSVHRVIPFAPRITFGELARFAWPQKAEAHLSFVTGYDARTCRRWLAGATQPPAEALGVVLAEIMRRFHQRE